MTEADRANQANARLQAAIDRHAGWQLEYDFAIVINDRRRLLAEINRLATALAQAWTETDEARQIARGLRKICHIELADPDDDPQSADWHIEGALDLDALPDWLTTDDTKEQQR